MTPCSCGPPGRGRACPTSRSTWTRTLADALAALARPPGLRPARPRPARRRRATAACEDGRGRAATRRHRADRAPGARRPRRAGRRGAGLPGQGRDHRRDAASARSATPWSASGPQATQQQLREISVSAAEQARLERGLLPTPLLRTDAVALLDLLPARPRRRRARRRLLRRRRDAPTAGCGRSSATSWGTARTRRRSACTCASPGARCCWPACPTSRSCRRWPCCSAPRPTRSRATSPSAT